MGGTSPWALWGSRGDACSPGPPVHELPSPALLLPACLLSVTVTGTRDWKEPRGLTGCADGETEGQVVAEQGGCPSLCDLPVFLCGAHPGPSPALSVGTLGSISWSLRGRHGSPSSQAVWLNGLAREHPPLCCHHRSNASTWPGGSHLPLGVREAQPHGTGLLSGLGRVRLCPACASVRTAKWQSDRGSGLSPRASEGTTLQQSVATAQGHWPGPRHWSGAGLGMFSPRAFLLRPPPLQICGDPDRPPSIFTL